MLEPSPRHSQPYLALNVDALILNFLCTLDRVNNNKNLHNEENQETKAVRLNVDRWLLPGSMWETGFQQGMESARCNGCKVLEGSVQLLL